MKYEHLKVNSLDTHAKVNFSLSHYIKGGISIREENSDIPYNVEIIYFFNFKICVFVRVYKYKNSILYLYI